MQQAKKMTSGYYNLTPGHRINSDINAVPEKKQKKAKLLLILLSCFLLSLVVVAQYSSLVILNYSLGGVRAELALVQGETDALELQVAELSSIGRIDEIARNELGMIDPEIGQLRIITAGLDDNSRLGE